MIAKLLQSLLGKVGLKIDTVKIAVLAIAAVAVVVTVVWLVVALASAKAQIAVCEGTHAKYVAQAEKDAADAEARYRRLERASAEQVISAQLKYNEEKERADSLEVDLAAAVRSGQRRVRESICATRSGVPGHAATAGTADGGAQDGSQRIGRIVRAAALCDAQVRGLQSYARTCQATCGPQQ